MRKLRTDLQESYRRHKALFDRYADLLIRWNQKINLTAITEPDKIAELHFSDSLSVAAWIQESREKDEIVSRGTIQIKAGLRILDIGAGAGFPGIPVKIALPDIHLTLIDSVKKKCDFLKEVSRSLSLSDIHVLHERVDEKKSFGQFDMVVSRATFKLKDLLLYAKPNLKMGGIVMGMKSLAIPEEWDQAKAVLLENGFRTPESVSYTLPVSGQERQLVVIRFT